MSTEKILVIDDEPSMIRLCRRILEPGGKARAIEVGADAYIAKSSFDQANLLQAIEQLV